MYQKSSFRNVYTGPPHMRSSGELFSVVFEDLEQNLIAGLWQKNTYKHCPFATVNLLFSFNDPCDNVREDVNFSPND